MAAHFHPLVVSRISPEAAGAAAITLAVPNELHDQFDFRPGQFLTMRAKIGGQEARRSYSICSAHSLYDRAGEIDVGIKPVEGGVFSRWALANLRPGSRLDVMPPDGRFTPRVADARHRAGFACGSGITPMLSIIASTLESEADSRFTLVYGNQRVSTIMFNEALQDLKDKYPARLSLVHVLSRQPQEMQLLNGRLDESKVAELLRTVLEVDRIDEVFLCGPEGMIESAQRALLARGYPADRILSERFVATGQGNAPVKSGKVAVKAAQATQPSHRLEVVLDGKTHQLAIGDNDKVLDAALDAGLDLPYSCRGGVCCTCRAKVLEGEVQMEKNFTLEQWEVDKGFVLTCQARPLTPLVVVSYDER